MEDQVRASSSPKPGNQSSVLGHIGLVNAAWAIAQAQQHATSAAAAAQERRG